MTISHISNKVLHGDAVVVLSTIPSESIDVCFTSPSPFLYNAGKGIGTEATIDKYLYNLMIVFLQVFRVLKDSGSCYVNLNDFHDPKTGALTCAPEYFVTRMDQMGWLKRSNIAWVRTERFETQDDYSRYARDWENVYFFTKTNKNYFNNGRQKVVSSVFSYPYTPPRKQQFESGFPEKLIEKALHYSAPPNSLILDPLAGTGITGMVAKRLGHQYIMIDISEENVHAMQARLRT